MDEDHLIAELLRDDPLFATLTRYKPSDVLVKIYRRPGAIFGRATRTVFPDRRFYEKLYFPCVALPLRDPLDIEYLWRSWTVAVTPAAIGNPCGIRRPDGSCALLVFIYEPFAAAATKFWDTLCEQLDEARQF